MLSAKQASGIVKKVNSLLFSDEIISGHMKKIDVEITEAANKGHHYCEYYICKGAQGLYSHKFNILLTELAKKLRLEGYSCDTNAGPYPCMRITWGS